MIATKPKKKGPAQRWFVVTYKKPKQVIARNITVRADNADHARDMLPARKGEQITAVVESGTVGAFFEGMRNRFDQNKVNRTLGECASLLRGGVPIHEALRIQIRRTKNPHLQYFFSRVVGAIKSGLSVAAAFAEFPAICDSRLKAILEVGQSTGHIDEILDKLHDEAELHQKIWARFQNKLYYPYAVAWVIFSLFLILSYKVMPNVTAFYTQYDVPLPWFSVPTFSTGALFVEVPVLAVVAAGLLIAGWLRKEAICRWKPFLNLVYRIPRLGTFLNRMEYASAISSLSISLNAGLQLVPSMDLAGGVFKNPKMRAAWNNIHKDLSNAVPTLDAFENHADAFGTYGDELVAYVRLGEASSRLAEQIERYSHELEESVSQESEDLDEIISPIITIMLVVSVGLFIFPVQYPMLQIGRILQGSIH